MTREQIDQLQRLVTDAAAPLPSIIELLDTTDPDVHLGTVRELIRTVDDRTAKVADAAGRLQPSGEGKSSSCAMTEIPHPDVEDVATRIQSVVATLQMALEGLPQDGRVGDIPDVLALCRDSLSDQQQALEQIVETMTKGARS